MTYICNVGHVKKHQRTSKNGIAHTVNAHTRTVCRRVDSKREYARKKAREAKPNGQEPITPEVLMEKYLEAIKNIDVEFVLKKWKKNFRYKDGNWFGPGWWGGSEDSRKPGNQPPVDSLDAVAMRHDFGYQIAEEYGKVFMSPALEQQIKTMADLIAVRDALTLSEDPEEWLHPPNETEYAKKARAMMIIGFTGVTPTINHTTALVGEFKKNLVDMTKIITLPLSVSSLGAVLTRYKLSKIDPNINIENLDKMMDYRVYQWYCSYNESQ